MPSNILLTGATGFIGTHLAENIIASGHNLKILTRRKNDDILSFEKAGALISICEMSNKDALSDALKNAETVIHLAGATRTLTEKDMFRVNVEYTENLLEACHGKNIHFIYISSQAAAGPALSPDRPVTESDAPRPVTWYGKSKLEAEIRVKKWGENNSGRFTIIRPPSVYGPREKDIFACFKLMKKNIAFSMGFKAKKLSVIYVKDLVSAISHTVDNIKPEGKTYFACSDNAYTWEELFAAIASAMNKNNYLNMKLPEFTAFPVAMISEIIAKATKKPALLNFQKIAEMKEDFWVCSNSLLRSTGWKPDFSIEKGMKETVEWYVKNGWL